MSVTTLSNTTWYLNSSLTLPSSTTNYSINFISHDIIWKTLQLNSTNMGYQRQGSSTVVYYSGTWNYSYYKTINIIDGTDATNASLISWLESNATQIFPLLGNPLIIGSSGSSTNVQSSKSYTVSTSGSQTISPDSGYDAMEAVALTVPAGSATPPASIYGQAETVSAAANVLYFTATITNTPQVTAGYISAGTQGNTEIRLGKPMGMYDTQTITPGTTNQTLTSGSYLYGTQTILGDANLVAANIASGITIFGVTGTHAGGASVGYWTGSTIPSDALGDDGDIYVLTS